MACSAWKRGLSPRFVSRPRSGGNSPSASTAIGTISTADRQAPAPSRYRGRFAPSPTGPLHLGSLVAATASYLQALVAGGEWLLRIEDIDPPRELPGATDDILRVLESHGFCWSGDIRWQRQRQPGHLAAVEVLLAANLAFRCDCSRKDILAVARRGPTGPVYPGTCRHKAPGMVPTANAAIRIAAAPTLIRFVDRLQGPQCCRLDRDIGDFVIRRRDGLIAYVLAATLDDHAQRITEVVRGTDLLVMTPGQIWLQSLLGLDEPAYLHVPVVRNAAGQKLSKQTGAQPLAPDTPGANLCQALTCLGQRPPAELARDAPGLIWDWAAANWDPQLAGRETGDLVQDRF